MSSRGKRKGHSCFSLFYFFVVVFYVIQFNFICLLFCHHLFLGMGGGGGAERGQLDPS